MTSDASALFPPTVYRERLQRAAKLAAGSGLDALLVTPGPDLRFLIGSQAQSFERLTCLVVPGDGSAATVVLPRLELASLSDSVVADLELPVLDWVDGTDPYRLVGGLLRSSPLVAVSDSIPALHLIPLSEQLQTCPILATGVLRELRMTKDAAEIAALRKAGAAIDRVHARMGEWLKVGRTEADVAADIAAAIVAEGHTAAAFVIVGSGPHGADPHHEKSDRVIEAGDVVVVDIGGPVAEGYNSDSTRTYVLGEPDPQIAEQFAVLERAQAAAVAAVRPGVSAEAIDAAARELLIEAGLGEAFVHRTGHGIGLSIHEEPYIVGGNSLPLTPGMAFSVEPGIYFRGRWGARIEDIVIVTTDGCESLNNRPHGLTRL